VKGDLVVRTKELNNTRNIFVINNKQITPDFTDRDMTVLSDVSIFGDPYTITAELTPLPDKWFGPVYFSRLGFEDDGTGKAYLNNTRMKSRVLENSLPGLILSGRNIYINSDNLSNQISKIEAGKDIFLTGNKLINESKRKSSLNHFIIYDLKLEPVPTVYPYKKSGETQTWNDEDDVIEPASIIAKGSLVADFKDNIDINTALPDDIKTVSEVNVKERPETVSAEKIILHAGQINITDKIKAINELNIIAEKEINLHDAALLSSN
ncbi:hemagglutinin, partial [Photorhabdus khanii subsp. guanajuatensis]